MGLGKVSINNICYYLRTCLKMGFGGGEGGHVHHKNKYFQFKLLKSKLKHRNAYFIFKVFPPIPFFFVTTSLIFMNDY